MKPRRLLSPPPLGGRDREGAQLQAQDIGRAFYPPPRARWVRVLPHKEGADGGNAIFKHGAAA